MFDAILIDLDNTLYDYTSAHQSALTEVFLDLSAKYGFREYSLLESMYQKHHSMSQSMLESTAGAHDKLLVFKKMASEISDMRDKNGTKFCVDHHSLGIYMSDLYWKSFYKYMTINRGVVDFLNLCRSYGIKICVVTDFAYSFQVKKLEKLGILTLVDLIVSSYEVGSDKPDPKIFYYALDQLRIKFGKVGSKAGSEFSVDTVCMIGDNLKKDIGGARNLGIYSFLFDPNGERTISFGPESSSFNSFEELHFEFESIFARLDELVYLSKWSGQRFDLVQAAGGNISVKQHISMSTTLMMIKSSGVLLSEVEFHKGYSILSHGTQMIKMKTKPSIETSMHTILRNYTVHLHSIQVNKLCASSDGEEVLKKLFPEALVIPYLTPGWELADKIRSELPDGSLDPDVKREGSSNKPNVEIIFLISHGLIVTSDDYDRVIPLINFVIDKIESHLMKTDLLSVAAFQKYKPTVDISQMIHQLIKVEVLTYCSRLVVNVDNPYRIITPDTLVYCGPSILQLSDDLIESQIETFRAYLARYHDYPKMVIYRGNIYISGHSLKKCREIEDVFESTQLITSGGGKYLELSEEEIHKLLNWDAEKFRMTQ